MRMRKLQATGSCQLKSESAEHQAGVLCSKSPISELLLEQSRLTRRNSSILTIEDEGGNGKIDSMESYDPAGNLWTSIASIVALHRQGQMTILLDDGRAQIRIEGGLGFSNLDTVEIYTSTGGGWRSGERLFGPAACTCTCACYHTRASLRSVPYSASSRTGRRL